MTEITDENLFDRDKDPEDMSRGEKVCAFIEEYCRVPEGALVGQQIKLAPFQVKFILDIYDNKKADTHTGILSIARKNAKTATIACILMAHIAGPEAVLNSQIISGAMSRDQAALVFNLAVKMIRLDPRLEQVTKIVDSTKRVVGLRKNVEYRAISADGTTAHGLSPILAILDEVGQVKGPSSPFVEAILTSQGAHDKPIVIMISTQSPSDADFLSLQIDDAISGQDPGIICHLYAADADCDILDEGQWKKANPGLGYFRSRSDLVKQLEKASRLTALEASSRNLLLNQRVALESLWLSPTEWKANNAKPEMSVFQNNPVHLGLDLSQKKDLTAAVFSAKDPATEQVHIIPFVFTPLKGIAERSLTDRVPYEQWVKDGFMFTAGYGVVDYEVMAGYLRNWLDRNSINLTTISYDRWRIEDLQSESKEAGFGEGAEWIPVGQGYKDMAPRIDKFEETLLAHEMRHGGHPLMNMAASNAIAIQDATGQRKLDKTKSTQKIDPIVAAVMSVYEAVTQDAPNDFDASLLIG